MHDLAVHMSRCTAGRLDERRLAAQKSFLVGVENADERNFRKIETFAEQIDPDQDVEICRLVQRSHDSGVAPAGRLLAGREALLTHFYKLIVEMMEGPG